jgi:PAS domain S-box-containing protein
MTGKNHPGSEKATAFQNLRKQVEEKLAAGNKSLEDFSPSEMQALIRELYIHQVELEMQNEELRKRQAETERSCKAFQDFWELSPVGYLIVDISGRVTAVNRAGQRLLGRKENALLKERFSMLVIPENQESAHLMFERAAETGIAERQEIGILKPDGSVNTCLLEVRSLGGEPGREQIQAILTDITKKKRTEDDLRKSEQEKIAILNSLMEHVVYHDREMRILWANKAACESVRMKREDLLGRHCHEIWADRRTPCEDCPVIKARDTGQPQMVEKMTPDERWWHIKGHPVRDKKGHVTGMTELTLDITERKRYEEIIRNAKDELEIEVEKRTAELIKTNEKLKQEIKVRKKAEKELQASKMLLSSTFYALQDMLVVIDKDFRILMSNWKDHEYISEKDRQGHPFCYEVFMHRNKPCDPCHAMEVFATGEVKQLEFANPIDEKIRNIHVIPMFDDKGKVDAVIEHLHDITERIQAQEEMRKSEARYRALSEATFEAIFISENGICLDTNQRATELFEYDYNELIGIFGTDIIAPESKELVRRNMLSGYEKPYEAIAQKKDGTKFHVEIRGKMMKYEGKDVRMTVVRDINEQKLAVEALRESEKRYRNLFNRIPIGLYRTTPEGSILDVNPAMLEILGYPDQGTLMLIEAPEIYVDPDDRQQFQSLLEEKGFVHDFMVQLHRLDGRKIWVSLNATIIHDASSQKTYYEGAMEDITDRKASEERIHLLSQQLMQAQEDERQMLSRELHDTVAQDLSVAKMTCDVIFNQMLNNRPMEIRQIQDISGVLNKTIHGVRNMAYELRPPGLEKLGLVETIYRFCEDFAQMWGLPVDFQAAGLKNLELAHGIQINVYRLVQEGLTNVRKHAAAGRVTVRLAAAFPNIVLRIEDNGRGFDVQKRAAAAGQEKRMGLRSMQERVTLLNGEMKLQSRAGQGTKVFIKLPFAEKKTWRRRRPS